MKYSIKKNEILIFDKNDFNPQHILECGQIFRYQKTPEGYEVWSQNRFAQLFETDFGYKIVTSDPKYFEEFFDLKTDYSKIKTELEKFEILQKPIEFGGGIRLLKNDAFEVLVSFIISANNNIKRIQKSLFALCEKFGGFPSHEQLLSLSVQDFVSLGLGYRAPQLHKALRQISPQTLKSWRSLPTQELREKLITLSGVGPKVADCVLLFGFWRTDVFPVDTWINKMFNMFYSPETNRSKIRNQLLQIFGSLSGYAQQYLFYFQRSFLKK